MVKKVVLPIMALCLAALVGFTGFGIWHSLASRPTFSMDGYVLQGGQGEAKQLAFAAQEAYVISRAGYVSFRDSQGEKASVRRESFVYLSDGSIMALCDGILLDFNDLSENFINNYYITSALPIVASGGTYTAETNAGTVTFGENLWKLSENKYIVRSTELTVCVNENDRRPAGEYVQVTVTPDGIVQLLTAENLWTTISPDCYIETASGIKIYPVSQLVDDGTHKLSLAKLSVSADDSIVLTESETRRQIVPELNIEAVDGEDGADGEAGENGEQGVAGEKGVDGEKGIDGEKGADGEQGVAGADGQQGENGAQGVTGEQGVTGANGAAGAAGAAGSSGSSGSSGASGASGRNGTGGTDGYTGNKGNDATIQSSTNAALPVMSFVDWQVNATSLKGAISVSDESGLLELGDLTSTEEYAPTVTIYEVDTGRAVACYEVNEGYSPTTAIALKAGSLQHEGTTYFMTVDPDTLNVDLLTPDTNYRVSVVAYYRMSDMIYSREFISRFFYTDSTGLYLDYDSATTSSLTINARVPESYQGAIKTAEILLLTPAQNRNLNTASDECVARYTLDYQAKTINYYDGTVKQTFPMGSDLKFDQRLTFGAVAPGATALGPDERYVARVFVTTSSSTSVMNVLTSQTLEMDTLRQSPEWESGRKPSANFNRVTGAFEVYRPPVTDPDGGVIRYVYTALKQASDGTWEEIPGAQKTQLPNETGPVAFFLPSGVDYSFRVALEFNDNEKTVSYDMGRSDPISSTGDTLPRLTLEVDEYGSDYNYMRGKLHIDMSQQSSKLTVDSNHILTLEVYADQIYDRKIQIDNDTGTPVKEEENSKLIYSATLDRSSDPNTNRATVDLVLQNLYKNTNYTILVTGYIDLNDGNGTVRRALGTTSFRTLNTFTLNARWNIEGGTSDASVSRVLTLELQEEPTGDAAWDAQRESWALSQLKQGQVTLKISRGTGPSRTLLATTNLTNSTQKKVEDLYTNGVEITEKDFTLTLDAGTAYTLEVDLVSDQTYGMSGLSYQNTFEVSVSTRTEVVTGKATPPDLITDPTKGVTADPILNKDAALYGGTVDESLPEDTIVGYRLASTYDNSQRLGLRVNYYVFEYNNFYNALKTGKDPVWLTVNGQQVTAIAPVTIDFPAGSNEAPKVALLFGGGTTSHPVRDDNYYNGYYCYYAGDADFSSGSLAGMGRGYRYVFAYTVDWSENAAGSAQLYPYNPTSAYEDYKNAYGAGAENGVVLGRQVAYILNSGMRSAPRLEPEFHTYVYETGSTTWDENTGITSGTVDIHYTWRDLDKTIVETGDNATRIEFMQGANKASQPLYDEGRKVTTSNAGAKDWFELAIPYEAGAGGDNMLEPTVNISLYRPDYSTVIRELGIGGNEEDAGAEDVFYLCRVPVDRGYGNHFQHLQEQNLQAYVKLEPHLSENYIDFILTTEGSASDITRDLGNRAYAMKLDVEIVTENTGEDPHPKTIYLPMRYQLSVGYHARLASGALGAEYVGKTFQAEAEILYDTGDQGWKLIEDVEETDPLGGTKMVRSNFALQYIMPIEDRYELGNYLAGGNGTSGTYGAIAYQLTTGSDASTQNILTTDMIRSLVRRNAEDDHTAPLSIQGVSDGWRQFRYVYPTQQGVAQGNNSSLQELSQTVVPKGVSSYQLSFPDGKNTCTLDQITPTIQKGDFITAGTQVDVFNFRIISQEQAGTEKYTWPKEPGKTTTEYVVHALLFNRELDANNFASTGNKANAIQNSEILLRLGNGDTNKGRPQDDMALVDGVRQSGVIRPMDDDNKPILEPNHTYYVVFYMLDKSGNPLVLVDQTTALKAIYPVQTAADLVISSENGLVYNNTGYFNKTLNLLFNLSRTSGVNMEYTLYDAGGFATGTKIYTDQQMRDNGMLQAKKTGFTGSNNAVTIQMIPSELRRGKLMPGMTYCLYLRAYEAGGTDIGQAEFTVRLPPVSNYGALIYVGDAGKDFITYTVSINDVGYSIMGHDKVNQGVGLYAVRFTDDKDNWIQTIYDGKVFDASSPKQDFVLKGGAGDDATITQKGYQLDRERKYQINIYAVVDKDHDGLSELVPVTAGNPATTEGKDYKYFFGSGESVTMDSAGGSFKTFLDQFWKANATVESEGFPKTDTLGLWDQGLKLRLAQKKQSLTDPEGLYVNTQKASLSRRGSRLLLTLSESFGVAKKNEISGSTTQAFAAVEWQIEGYTQTSDGQMILSYNERTTTGDNPFVIGTDVAGYNIFTYEIPQDIPYNSVCEVTLQLYKKDASNLVLYETLSFMYTG